MAIKVVLVYPYFHPANDNSIFRFPPLGLGYLASALLKYGFETDIVDCTFLDFNQAIERVINSKPQIVGFYSMFSMKKTTLELAKAVRKRIVDKSSLFIVGGPLPTWDPKSFLETFDLVVLGEGEETIVELADCLSKNFNLSSVKGLIYKDGEEIIITGSRGFVEDLDQLEFPLRKLFDNASYKKYYSDHFGYTTSAMITSRGCPFSCDFCSRPIFGTQVRSRSAKSIVDEVEQIADLGYERVWFADDCFTLNRDHLLEVCDELINRRLNIDWECLSRVDTMDSEVADRMKHAGCLRVFFGIESGNDRILGLMNKCITTHQAKNAVYKAKAAGLKVGAFFIVGYPGETNNSVLDTVRFASALPLDYLSFTLPYPIPGTPLYERVKEKGVSIEDWEEPKNYKLIRHKLLYEAGFTEGKLKFAIGKAHAQFYVRKYLGKIGYGIIGKPFEIITDWVFSKLT